MLTTDDDRLREVLDEAECRRLLATTATGRLGFTDSALPDIVPVSYTVYDSHVCIAARRDSRLVTAVRGSVVALQADAYDAEARTGWSVTVVGPARIVVDPGQFAALDGVAPSVFSRDPSSCCIAVQLALVRGWQMTALPPSPSPRVAGSPVDGANTVTPQAR